MTPEGRIKKTVNEMLATFDTACWSFMPVQTGYGKQGLDYFLCFCGRFVAIETKKDAKSKLTPNQLRTRAGIMSAGGIVFVVYDAETLEIARRKLNWVYLANNPRMPNEHSR